MTTRRKQSMATGRRGVNFARGVVEQANCIFHETEQSNDIGNDAFIEFVVNEQSTGCCIAAQVKSGASYVNADGTLVLIADKDHFEYWSGHVLPVCGLVYDPATDRAGWCDVTEYLRATPSAIAEGPYRIPIDPRKAFSAGTFSTFREHFLKYKVSYSDDAHFGAALEQFAPFASPAERLGALKSLFSYHRNRAATWCYVASLLRSIESPKLLAPMVRALSHLPGHGDIWWGKSNEIEAAAKLGGLAFMRLTFGREEVIQLLRVVDENGFVRGSIGQAAHCLIGLCRAPAETLRSIAFDPALSEDVRYAAIFLFVYYAQEESAPKCVETLREYRRAFPDGFQDEIVVELIRTIQEHGQAGFY